MSDSAPTWDLQSYFPGFDSAERTDFSQQLETDVAVLLQRSAALGALTEENAPDWAELINLGEAISVRFGHLSSYLNNLVSTDVANEAYQLADAALSKLGAELTKIRTELLRALQFATEPAVTTLLALESMAETAFFVERAQIEAKHRMSTEEEALAADLGVDGIAAWGRLYSVLSGKMKFRMRFPDGREEEIPMARRRGLMADGDRAVRREAFERGNEVWAIHEDTMGAALNGIAGTRITLNRKRGVGHFLDEPLFESALDAQTLEAMHAGIEANTAPLHAALQAAAKSMGVPKLDWFDLEAPMPSWSALSYSWNEGAELLGQALERTYPDFAQYYRASLDKQWVEAQQRDGKLPGAYCTGTMLRKEERIFMTYMGNINDLMTLAHEFGHAWHSHLIEKSRRPLAAAYPMTLAETASTFGEALLVEGLRRDPNCDPKLAAALDDIEANRLHSFLVNIPVRFAFEKAFHEERMSGEVPVSRLKELMISAQRKYYGEALGETDPYFWASKLHFFITGISFYNFPYAFGFLLSRALFARYKTEGAGFLKRYEEFLINSGSMSCEEAARVALGVNLHDAKFWADAVG